MDLDRRGLYEPHFAARPPARIVRHLGRRSNYIAGESRFHRMLRAHGQMNRRGRRALQLRISPSRPSKVWCWATKGVTLLTSQSKFDGSYQAARERNLQRWSGQSRDCRCRVKMSALLNK